LAYLQAFMTKAVVTDAVKKVTYLHKKSPSPKKKGRGYYFAVPPLLIHHSYPTWDW